MQSLHLFKKVIVFVFAVFSLCFTFDNLNVAQASVYLSDSSTSQLSLPSYQVDETQWTITSVPIFPLLPGYEWDVKSESNGTKLAIKHDNKEVITLVKQGSSTSQLNLPSSLLDNTEWEITSVPIFPLLPGSEWDVKSESNGTKLVIKHGDEEVITLVKKDILL